MKGRPVHAVFFDLDGTLYDRDEHVLRMTTQQFAAFETELRGIEPQRFITRVLELDAHGQGRTPELFQLLARELALPTALALRLEADFRSRFHDSLILTDDTSETLQALRARGKKLGIITNGPVQWQARKVDALGIRHFFDVILISDEEGVRKPDVAIFERALQRCGAEAASTLFVGDYPDADIRGARDAGLIPVWKEMPYWTVPAGTLRIQRLTELLALCG